MTRIKIAIAIIFLVGLTVYAAPPNPRSGRWEAVRNRYLQAHTACEACGSGKKLNVHHVLPFEYFPEKELDDGNLITLCRDCHFVFGHLHDWSSFNPCVREDAARHLAEVKARLRSGQGLKKFERQFSLSL
jgi:hypothetical protein